MVIDFLFLLAPQKYALKSVSSPFSFLTNGGANPLVSSPAPGLSTFIISAPKSPSIWVQ